METKGKMKSPTYIDPINWPDLKKCRTITVITNISFPTLCLIFIISEKNGSVEPINTENNYNKHVIS